MIMIVGVLRAFQEYYFYLSQQGLNRDVDGRYRIKEHLLEYPQRKTFSYSILCVRVFVIFS